MMNTPTTPIETETEQQQQWQREGYLTPPMTVGQLKAMLSECPPHREIRMYCDEPTDRDIREVFAGESQATAIAEREAARLDRRLRYHDIRCIDDGRILCPSSDGCVMSASWKPSAHSMTVGELVEALCQRPDDRVLRMDGGTPYSYVPIGHMLDGASLTPSSDGYVLFPALHDLDESDDVAPWEDDHD